MCLCMFIFHCVQRCIDLCTCAERSDYHVALSPMRPSRPKIIQFSCAFISTYFTLHSFTNKRIDLLQVTLRLEGKLKHKWIVLFTILTCALCVSFGCRAITLDNQLVVLGTAAADAGRYYVEAVNERNGENKTSPSIYLSVAGKFLQYLQHIYIYISIGTCYIEIAQK